MTILDEYLEHTSVNEAPVQAHRWTFLACVAACLGRRVWFPFGDDDIYPNLYACVVGIPASRKSTAIMLGKSLLKESGYDTFAFTRTSREKFLLDFNEGFQARNDTGEIDFTKALDVSVGKNAVRKEVFVCADEFIDFIKIKNMDFINLLTTLFDCLPSYPERLKNSQSVNIPKPTISILGGFTPTSLSMAVPSEMIGQGFTSRFLLIHVTKKKRRVTIRKKLPIEFRAKVVEFFRSIQEREGPCQLSEDGYELLDEIYQNYGDLPDGRLQHYCSRRQIHLLKLCMIFAVIRGTDVISRDVVEQANSTLTHAELKMSHALGELGTGKHSNIAQKIVEQLESADTPVSMESLFTTVSPDLNRPIEFNEILDVLLRAKRIQKVKTSEGVFLTSAAGAAEQNPTGVNLTKWIKEWTDGDV